MNRCLHGLDSRFCSLCHPIPKPPVHRVRQSKPRRNIIPMWLWKAFVDAFLPIPARRLCLFCQRPLPLFSGVQRIGKRDGFMLKEEGTIVLGSLVRYVEREMIDAGHGLSFEDENHKVIPMFVSGIGCPDCQAIYSEHQHRADKDFAAAQQDWTAAVSDPRQRELIAKVGAKSPTKKRAFVDIADLAKDWSESAAGEAYVVRLKASWESDARQAAALAVKREQEAEVTRITNRVTREVKAAVKAMKAEVSNG